MAKKIRKWPELEITFAALVDAIDRKKFTKARGFASVISSNVIIAMCAQELTVAEKEHYMARLAPLAAQIPAKPKRKTARQLRREAHERWLYKNNTYQGPAS